MTKYEVIRMSQKSNRVRIIRRGLTLEEARSMCRDPETSSMTARKPRGCDGDETMIQRWHTKQKHWFYGFREAA